MRVNEEFLFGCATGFYSNWLDTSGRPGGGDKERQGISEGHAYSIMEAKEVKGKRLLKVRNPWGRKEWDGKWSDGSAEWDAEWLGLLGHKFGNDGVFWISYEDLLNKYQHFDRTRIFTREWNVSQAWVGVDVGWSSEYHGTRFKLTVREKGPVVIVLSQLDDTYFGGLEGCYVFDLQFRLEQAKEGSDPDDYLVRSNGSYAMARSVSTDIELEAGTYLVLMKITATREPEKQPVEDVLAEYVDKRRDKVIQMGMSYDLAHAKGVYVESKQEKKDRAGKEEKTKLKDKARLKKKMRERAEKHWRKEKMRHDREKERRMRKKKRGDASGEADDKSREENGSLDAQPAASAMGAEVARDNAHHLKQNGTKDHNVPLRIKSFSGQTIEVASPTTDAEAVPPVPPPTRQMTQAPERPNTEAQAHDVVQSLDEVIKTADNETQATKPDLPSLQISTSATNPVAETEEKPQTPIIQVNGKDAITDVKPMSTQPPLSTPEHTLPDPTAPATNGEPEKTLGQGLLTQDNMDSMRGFPSLHYGMMNGAHAHGDPDETGSMDSYPSFDWNSELDVPSEYGLDSESEDDDSSDDDDEDEDGTPNTDADPKASRREPRRLSTSSSSTNSEGDFLYKPPSPPPPPTKAIHTTTECIHEMTHRVWVTQVQE